MITFSNYTEDQDKEFDVVSSINITVDDGADLHQMCEAFGRFLVASGYYIRPHQVQIVEEDEE